MANTPPEMAELIDWFVNTVTPLIEKNGWSVTLNGNSGTVQTDVRIVEHKCTEQGDKRRVEIRDFREFRLKNRKSRK